MAEHKYAIVIDYPGAPAPAMGQEQGDWAGANSDPYPRGAVVLSNDGHAWIFADIGNSYDVHFQTYVVTP